MPDSPAHPDSGEAAGVGEERQSTTGTPRWVKVATIAAAVVVVLVVVMLLIGGGHGPGRH